MITLISPSWIPQTGPLHTFFVLSNHGYCQSSFVLSLISFQGLFILDFSEKVSDTVLTLFRRTRYESDGSDKI